MQFKTTLTRKDGTVDDFAVALRKFESGGHELVVASYTDMAKLREL